MIGLGLRLIGCCWWWLSCILVMALTVMTGSLPQTITAFAPPSQTLIRPTAATTTTATSAQSRIRLQPSFSNTLHWMITGVTSIGSSGSSRRHSDTSLQSVVVRPHNQTTTMKTAMNHTNGNGNVNVKYPTQRGSSTDARQIVATSSGRQFLEAVRISHILLASIELAHDTLNEVRSGRVDFASLATLVSACSYTRDEGGNIGWMHIHHPLDNNDNDNNNIDNPNQPLDDKNEHLDGILPKAAREQVIAISTKPGDIFLVESVRGYHLIHIQDVMQNVRKMALLKPGKSHQPHDRGSGLRPSNAPNTSRTYKLETMGCQMNQADSERIEGQLQLLGFTPLEDEEAVDDRDGKKKTQKYPNVIVLNTCSIRDHAEQKVYSYLGPHAKRKREGEDVTIIVAGCVAQQTGEALLRRAPEVDLVMGPQYANRLADLLEDVANGNQVVATEATHIMEDSTKPRRSSTTAAWVNVIYGCNERCSFCIVPTTRGVEQSRPVESIVREVTNLVVNEGYAEVTLLGQNVDAYGRDMIPKRKFSDLIRMVGSIPDLKRLRFVTSHPRYMSMGVIDAVAETPSACESFHIPFQSGNNEVLARMGRGHTREKYLHIVERIRSKLPDASITADVIVGFPGETEEQFQDSCRLMEEVVFDSVNTAAYSPRPNTPAALWDDQVPEDVKQDRLQRINEMNKRHAAQRRARMMGRVEEVLVEERNVKVPTQVMGRTRHGYIVYCLGEIDALRGKLVKVLIETTQTYYLAGRIVDE